MKLNPPLLGLTVPAFTYDGITIPFEMNPSVLPQLVKGFQCKISNIINDNENQEIILTLYNVNNVFDKGEVFFSLTDEAYLKLSVGTYGHVQLAYIDTLNEVGYYSTAAIAKYTQRPETLIQASNNNKTFIGIHKTPDINEGVYKYQFIIKDLNGQIFDDSGEQIHDSSLDNKSMIEDETNRFEKRKIPEQEFSNTDIGLDINIDESNKITISKGTAQKDITIYLLSMPDTDTTSFPFSSPNNYIFKIGDILPKNMYVQIEEVASSKGGYVKLLNRIVEGQNLCSYTLLKKTYISAYIKIPKGTIIDSELILIPQTYSYGLMNESKDTFITNKSYESNSNYFIEYKVSTMNNLKNSAHLTISSNTIVKPMMKGKITVDYDMENACVNLSLLTNEIIPGSYQLVRADSKTDYLVWTPLHSYQINNSILYFTHKDCTVEQGVKYKYGYQQYNANGIYSDVYGISDEIEIDFEHIYLSDKDRQIKIAYNPKVSSLKNMILEQRTDTIGGKYPFYFRNGNVEYKEFPIAGLISYLLDEDEFFMLRTELGFQDFSGQRNLTDSNDLLNLKVPTTNLVGYNYTAERKFKLELLDWLSNGEEKLFRSPQEGNYVVRLTGVSLTPNDLLNRMIHEFSATAYECGSSDINDMVAAGRLVDTSVQDERIFQAGSALISKDLIINLPEQARFEIINVDGAFPTTVILLIDKENNIYPYTIGLTGSLAISDLPAANTLSIANTPYPSGVINYMYSTPIGSANTDFDKITSVHTGATVGNENDLNNNIAIIYKAIITPINQESIIIINNNEEVKIRKLIELKNISSLSIPNNDATVIMYYQYYDVTYLQDSNNTFIQDKDEKLILVGEI